MRHMRWNVERCGECTPAGRCRNHEDCATHPDAGLASDIGAAWARFTRTQIDVRRPWPPFDGEVAEIALHLVTGLAREPRLHELARICHWRAGLVWEALELPRIRDRPYEAPTGGSAVYPLTGALQIRFRTRRRASTGLAVSRPGRRGGR
jgi:hypothetical protein